MIRAFDRLARSLRYKLLVLVLLPIVLVMPIIFWLAVHWSKDFSDQQLLRRVNTDLAVAQDVFQRMQADYLSELGRLAESFEFRQVNNAGDEVMLAGLLERQRQWGRLDFLYVADLQGRRLVPAHSGAGGNVPVSPLVKSAASGIPSVGVEMASRAALVAENAAMAETARMALLGTPRTQPTGRTAEDRGLIIRAVYPVVDAHGDLTAVLEGGVLLNRNYDFVDAIRDLVYGPGSLLAGSHGAVSVLLNDVRISTNIPGNEGARAIGTRASEDVRSHVLEQGHDWVDRAYEVNDWYVSAYRPIVDSRGERVGMLNAGFLEAPYRNVHQQALAVLFGVFVGVVFLATGIAVYGARTISRPVEAMTRVVRETQAGADTRIGDPGVSDELGELAHQFDRMLDLLEVRNADIRRAAEELEGKVQERTRELSQKNIDLERTIELLRKTRRQLVMAEKLAALGELTAAMAHEINNPAAVILGNVELLMDELGENVGPIRTEVELIIEQVSRIRSIVDRLLQYSRPADYSGFVETLDVNRVVEDTMALVEQEVRRNDAVVERELRATMEIKFNRQELQQVLVNLVLNAVHSIGDGGHICLRTWDVDADCVVISVSDDGAGIAAENLEKIFDPFFTTRGEGGTGLGLSVSYGFVRKYGGNIKVESTPDKGTTFEVWLRREPEFTGDQEALMEHYVKAS